MKFFLHYLHRIIKKIFDLIGLNLEIKKKTFTFLNVFNSYNEAHKASNNEDTYITKEFQNKLKLADLNNIEVSDKFNIFPLFCALTLENNNKKNLFLEIGGGCNPIFLYILKSLNKKFQFQVLEEKNFKIQIPEEYNDYLNYVYKLEDINFKDLKAVLFSSSIQYIENYKIILDKIFRNNIEFIFITATFFTNKTEDVFTLQNNMENVKFPYIFISFKEFQKLLNKNNYELIFHTKRNVGKYSHNILGNDEYFLRDLVFKLKT